MGRGEAGRGVEGRGGEGRGEEERGRVCFAFAGLCLFLALFCGAYGAGVVCAVCAGRVCVGPRQRTPDTNNVFHQNVRVFPLLHLPLALALCPSLGGKPAAPRRADQRPRR